MKFRDIESDCRLCHEFSVFTEVCGFTAFCAFKQI